MTRLVVTRTSTASKVPVILFDGVRHGLDADSAHFPKVLADLDSLTATHLATGNIIKDVRFKSDKFPRSSGDRFRSVLIKLLAARSCVSYLERLAAADQTFVLTDLSSGTVTRERVCL